jgi:prevent-host-death family protein
MWQPQLLPTFTTIPHNALARFDILSVFRFVVLPGLAPMAVCRGTPIAKVAIGSYIGYMRTVSIKEAKNRLTALAREVESGETVVVTRNGKPIFDLVPHRQAGGLNLEAIAAFKRKHSVSSIVLHIADDFDAPLPEDFLLRPLG